mmetsp:Transcript_109379/g.172402  ORF Transcript_109379/g.172402 Transcript_109379/m.172402 type:complete len:656 (-) Transcript_109379:139-2106(-)
MDWARGKLERAATRVSVETAGVSSKRERARIVGRLFADAVGRSASSLHDVAVTKAHDVHDQLTERRHEHKCHRNSQSSQSLGPLVDEVECTERFLKIEVLNANDLREESVLQAFATCDAYAAVVVGARGSCWAEKCEGCTPATTKVVPRRRHPRWNATVQLPLARTRRSLELMIRIMDSHSLASDQVLGEACIDLEAQDSGSCCLRLLGSGFASVCLRWGSSELPRGNYAFEQALGFWSAHEGDPALAADALMKVFQECLIDAERANEFILQAPLSLLFRACSQNVNDFMQALKSIAPLLEPHAKSRLVGAVVEQIALRPNATHLREEDFLFFLLRSSTGLDLMNLKRFVDTNGTRFDCLYIVNGVISDLDKQVELLCHFRSEADSLVDRPVHIISDIDMTVWVGRFGSSGPKLPQGRVPGAVALFKTLSCQVTFLTARPQIIESQTRVSLLDDLGIADAAMLKGDLSTVLQSLISRETSHRNMGAKKIENFSDFATIHPEARFIFFGDSGEGDLDFASQFVARPAAIEDFENDRIALIHDVVDESGLYPKTRATRRQELRASRVYVFDTYAAAALVLFQHGFLSPDSLRATAQACHDEFENLDPQKFVNDGVYFARRRELICDLEEVNAALANAEAVLVDVTSGKEGDIPWWRM